VEAELLELIVQFRGGLYGPAAATALEDLPYDARGILSGLYQVCGRVSAFAVMAGEARCGR
jgi:hypothetical protein